MPDLDLHSIWSVLQTEATGPDEALEVVASGVEIRAGEVLLGVDNHARRILLVPLLPGEAFAEDRTGRAIRLVRVTIAGVTYLAAVSLRDDLDVVFSQFVTELLRDISGSRSPASETVAALARWRLLFSSVSAAGILSDQAVIGLLAELVTLRDLLDLDEQRRLSVWQGPSGSQHDFRSGSLGLEVKGTLVREGRIVPISSILQLQEPPGGELYLYHYRFEKDADGLTIPQLVSEILSMGVEAQKFTSLIEEVGYQIDTSEDYEFRSYRVVERRMYEVDGDAFPRITPSNFHGGSVPPGTLRISYSIDLTNDPPSPLDARAVTQVLTRMTE